jgi:hypothetical protein
MTSTKIWVSKVTKKDQVHTSISQLKQQQFATLYTDAIL